jgi:DNA-binding NtrC family response regulator
MVRRSDSDAPANRGALDDELQRLNFIGESRSFREAVRMIRRVAACDATALVEGETGTGKELAARAIHYLGPRRDFPFIPLNCGAVPDSLLESELFGHEKGAFTDARDRRAGLVTEAQGGTLFLDEVEAMSPRAQVVLLRFLQDQKYRSVGGRELQSANVRIVAASNADLHELAERHAFRRDVLFRLAVVEVALPPLRERAGDVPLLARTFLERLCAMHEARRRRFDAESLRWMEAHAWPGNVRELQNVVAREFFLGDGEEIRLRGPLARARGHEGGTIADGQSFKEAKAEAVARFEREWLDQMLAKANGNITVAAKLSKKDRSAFNKLVRKHGITAHLFRGSSTRGTKHHTSSTSLV